MWVLDVDTNTKVWQQYNSEWGSAEGMVGGQLKQTVKEYYLLCQEKNSL